MTKLRAFPTDTADELNVLGHDGHALGMDGTQVGVFKETNKVGLCSLLKGEDSRSLKPQITLEVLGKLTHKTLEEELVDERRSVDFWYRRISRRATVPGL